eukprot:GFKZ01015894.1.p1 GENE.GFKZ01015894.1~~GFKZ01015894.1.p1  ORF type:complete len:104 (-),score=3.01 GFKZ01015894.1:33-344(-)
MLQPARSLPMFLFYAQPGRDPPCLWTPRRCFRTLSRKPSKVTNNVVTVAATPANGSLSLNGMRKTCIVMSASETPLRRLFDTWLILQAEYNAGEDISYTATAF